MLPLSRMPVEAVRQVTTLLFDLDGTFVTEDNLESETYRSLERVRENGIKTIAVTGRPAGWCDLMALWWPVDSVVGENGANIAVISDHLRYFACGNTGYGCSQKCREQ